MRSESQLSVNIKEEAHPVRSLERQAKIVPKDGSHDFLRRCVSKPTYEDTKRNQMENNWNKLKAIKYCFYQRIHNTRENTCHSSIRFITVINSIWLDVKRKSIATNQIKNGISVSHNGFCPFFSSFLFSRMWSIYSYILRTCRNDNNSHLTATYQKRHLLLSSNFFFSFLSDLSLHLNLSSLGNLPSLPILHQRLFFSTVSSLLKFLCITTIHRNHQCFIYPITTYHS